MKLKWLSYLRFKPCYKWNTFNTMDDTEFESFCNNSSFKPCYKWNTFNTIGTFDEKDLQDVVLNLVINGIPSIPLI